MPEVASGLLRTSIFAFEHWSLSHSNNVIAFHSFNQWQLGIEPHPIIIELSTTMRLKGEGRLWTEPVQPRVVDIWHADYPLVSVKNSAFSDIL